MTESDSNYWRGRRVSRRAIVRGAALGGIGLAASALIGCGEEDEPEGTAASGGVTATAASTEVAPQGNQKSGGRLARAASRDTDTFDLHASETSGTMTPAAPMYNKLIQFDPMKVDDGPDDIIPDLAESWEVAPDGMTYTFNLVQNAKFHDGKPFTSADVRATIERQQAPDAHGMSVAPRGAALRTITAIETPDDYTVIFKTGRPAAPSSFLPMLAQGWMAIYSEQDIGNGFDYKTGGNGTGPYRNLTLRPGSQESLDKNPDYHVPGRPFLDGLDFYIIPETGSRNAAFEAKQTHMQSVNASALKALQASMGDSITHQRRPDLVFDMMSFNTTKAPWNDERVRTAFSRAINRVDAIDIVMQGEGVQGGYLRPGGPWALPASEFEAIPGYEPHGANTLGEIRKLLDAAGVPEGFEVPLLIRDGVSNNQGLFTGDQLAKVGINVRQDAVQSAIAYQRLNDAEFELVVFGLTTSLDDPDSLWNQYHLDGSPGNYTNVTSPEVEELFIKQSTELDPEARKELVNELQRVTMPLLGKVIFYWKISNLVLQRSVKDFVMHARAGDYNNQVMQDVWLDA